MPESAADVQADLPEATAAALAADLAASSRQLPSQGDGGHARLHAPP